MFHKYVQSGGELSENIKPFDSGLDSELRGAPALPPPQTQAPAAAAATPAVAAAAAASEQKDFRLVRLTSHRQTGLSELGVFVARVHQVEIGCAGYFIAHIVPDGLVKR